MWFKHMTYQFYFFKSVQTLFLLLLELSLSTFHLYTKMLSSLTYHFSSNNIVIIIIINAIYFKKSYEC